MDNSICRTEKETQIYRTVLMGLKWEMVSQWAFSIYLKHTCYPV